MRASVNQAIRFSWTGLILAPLPIPFIFSALLEISAPGQSPILSFLFFFVVGGVVSYGATLFLLLPSLILISRLTPLTAHLTGLVGTVLGGVIWLPVLWLSYRTSGDNSGPPQGSFGEYLRRELLGQEIWMFLMAGLVTALLYWFLAGLSSRRNYQQAS